MLTSTLHFVAVVGAINEFLECVAGLQSTAREHKVVVLKLVEGDAIGMVEGMVATDDDSQPVGEKWAAVDGCVAFR